MTRPTQFNQIYLMLEDPYVRLINTKQLTIVKIFAETSIDFIDLLGG